MKLTRKGFLGSLAAAGAAAALPERVFGAVGADDPTPEELRRWTVRWKYYLDPPEGWREGFAGGEELVKTYDCHPDCTIEVWRQNCGPNGRVQRVVKAIPRNIDITWKVPAVIAPFYIPELLLGCELDDPSKTLERCSCKFMLDLVRRGYIVASNDCFHENYCDCPDLARNAFARWEVTGKKILTDWPSWTPMALKVHDAMLVTDLVCRDERVDTLKMAMVGHSLGGQSAFYAGCWDNRVKAILGSDFTFRWDRSYYDVSWYFGGKLSAMVADGLEPSQLLTICGAKPFMCIAGWYDDDTTWRDMLRAKGYADHPWDLAFINHRSGHAPPKWALDAGYNFIERKLRWESTDYTARPKGGI